MKISRNKYKNNSEQIGRDEELEDYKEAKKTEEEEKEKEAFYDFYKY